MTFGYDADLVDRRSLMSLENWAENLLQSLIEVRASKMVLHGILMIVQSIAADLS